MPVRITRRGPRRHGRWRPPGVSAILAVALTALTVGSGVAASADRSPAPGDRVDVRVVGGGPLTFPRLAPGIGATRELVVNTTSRSGVRVQLGLRDLVSDDNGCLGPEERAGDTTCTTEGELLPWLSVRLERLDDAAVVPVFDGTLSQLAAKPSGVALGRDVRRDAPVTLRMTVVPAYAMGNDTMTDTVGFTVRVTARAAGQRWVAAAELRAGTTGDSGPAGTSGLPLLAGILTAPELLLVIALLCLLLGWLRRRHAQRPAFLQN